MNTFKRCLAFVLSLGMLLTGNIGVYASELGTQLILDNTTLEPEEITYSISIPISMQLYADIENAGELNEDVEYKSRSSIILQGNGIKDGLTINLSSVDSNDTGNNVTLTATDDGTKTKNGTFRIGDVSNVTSYTLTEDDYDAVTGVGLEIEVAIDGVTNADHIDTYTGGLVYTISEDIEVIQDLSVPGLYDVDNNIICSYDDLVENYGLKVDKTYTSTSYKTDPASAYNVFRNNVELTGGTKLVLGNDIVSIGSYAFTDVSNLEYIRISDTVVTLTQYSFYNCTGLKRIKIPSSVITIESNAFENCTSLETVTVPNSVTSLGGKTFMGCKSLYRAALGSGLKTVGDYTFANCTLLTDVRLQKELTAISNYMFNNCTSLEKFPECKVTKINGYAFAGCTSFEEVILPNTVTDIYQCAFADCSELRYIELPDSLKTLSGGLFFVRCKNLTSIYIPSSVTTISFSGVANLPFLNCLSGLQIYCGANSESGYSTWWDRIDNSTILNKYFGVTREEYYSIIGR